MNTHVWPFLVSRSRHLDYRAMLAPDFICDKKISSLLARVADSDLTEENTAIYRKIYGATSGDFSVVFRVITVTAKEVNLPFKNHMDETLKDQFGREIYLIEGIVLKEMDDFVISRKDLEEAHMYAKKAFHQFWNYVDPQSAIPSSPFSLDPDQVTKPLNLYELEPFTVTRKRPQKSIPKVALWIALAATTLLILGPFLF